MDKSNSTKGYFQFELLRSHVEHFQTNEKELNKQSSFHVVQEEKQVTQEHRAAVEQVLLSKERSVEHVQESEKGKKNRERKSKRKQRKQAIAQERALEPGEQDADEMKEHSSNFDHSFFIFHQRT